MQFVFAVTLVIALLSALIAFPLDCDEVFNYWEPLHIFLFGCGFKAWEYAPQYALRSWTFLITIGWPAIILKPLVTLFPVLSVKSWMYIFVKCGIAVANWIAFNAFSQSLLSVASISALLLYSSAGFFFAQSALLPNSILMPFVMFIYKYWTAGQMHRIYLLLGIASIIVSPYSLLFVLPFIFTDSVSGKFSFHIRAVLMSTLIILMYVVFPSIALDSYVYGRFAFSSWNAFIYNVFQDRSSMYGTEPWHWYIGNLILNWNIMFPIAFTPLNILIEHKERPRRIATFFAMIAPFVVFSIKAHKEERFLYPIYPLIALNAAYNLLSFQIVYEHILKYAVARFNFPLSSYLQTQAWRFTLVKIILGIYLAINVLRIIRIVKYEKPVENLFMNAPEGTCVGDVWPRYPSSFLVLNPENIHWIKDSFNGLIPAKITKGQIDEPEFNDLNLEITTRYISDVSQCKYYLGENVTDEEMAVQCVTALHSEDSFRYFYVPFRTRTKLRKICLIRL